MPCARKPTNTATHQRLPWLPVV